MKIAHFVEMLKKGDGVYTVVLALCAEAEKNGDECVVVAGQDKNRPTLPVKIINVSSITFPFYREYRITLPRSKKFYEELDKFNPDVIHVHSPFTIARSALAYAKKKQIPVIATHHTDFLKYLSYYKAGFLKPLGLAIYKNIYNRIDLVTTPSVQMSEVLIKQGIKNVKTIPWGVDLSRFNPRFRSEKWRTEITGGDINKKILLYVGRLTWEKDFKTFALTYKLLKDNRSDFVMVLAGEGPIQRELEKLMKGAIFLGYINGQNLSEVYASSDILLYPSSTETFGMSAIEGMASGLVPVVADSGGLQSMVKDGESGLLGKTKNPQNFYEKISQLLDDIILLQKMRDASLEIAKKYSWEHVYQNMLDEYRKIVVKN
jgi:glycosyltransferase involved in cell wall biosynthesis